MKIEKEVLIEAVDDGTIKLVENYFKTEKKVYETQGIGRE